MSRLTRVLVALSHAARVVRRRPLAGPQRPGWSWRYELMMEVVRGLNAQPPATIEGQRAAIDAYGEPELKRGRVEFSRTRVDGVPAMWAEPPAARPGTLVVYLHGGGYVIGSSASHRPLLAGIAGVARVRVLSLDYRLAPEHPCPAAIEDVVRAYRWLIDDGHEPARIVLAGDSAGGGLCLATLAALAAEGLPTPAGAVLLSPWADLTLRSDSVRAGSEVDYVTAEHLAQNASHYAGDLPLDDPRVSPLFADAQGYPPLLIIAGGDEILLDDSTVLAQRAEAAGVDVDLYVEEGEVHVYPYFATINPRGEAALERIARFIRRVCA